MDGFTLVYSIALFLALVLVAALLAGCGVLLALAHRRGRLREVVAGTMGTGGFASKALSTPRAVDAGGKPPDLYTDVFQVNPATGLPMTQLGTDVQGNLFGMNNNAE